MIARIREAHWQSRYTYGSRRIMYQLRGRLLIGCPFFLDQYNYFA